MAREVLETMREEKAQAGRREVAVQVQRVSITPRNGDAPFTVVDVNIVLGSKYEFHMSVPEAEEVARLVGVVMQEAKEEHEATAAARREKRREGK